MSAPLLLAAMTAPAIESTDLAPDHLEPCWVGVGFPSMCPDRIAEWLTNNGASPQWLPTCTGCKDRFVRLNPATLVRPLT